MNDMVPRSRLDAVELELDDAEIRLRKIQRNAAEEIERLTAEGAKFEEQSRIRIESFRDAAKSVCDDSDYDEENDVCTVSVSVLEHLQNVIDHNRIFPVSGSQTSLIEDYEFMCDVLDGPKWSEDPPKSDGWYWWRNLPDLGPKILHVIVSPYGDAIQANVNGGYILIEHIGGEWLPDQIQMPSTADSRQWTLNKWDMAWRDGTQKVWASDVERMTESECEARYPGLWSARVDQRPTPICTCRGSIRGPNCPIHGIDATVEKGQ